MVKWITGGIYYILGQNNLHSYAMQKPLATDRFRWFDSANYCWEKYDQSSLKDCILEVDLEYL